MTDANYQRHLKVLGKLAKLFDTATADTTTQNTLLSVFVDQYATGTIASLPAVILFPAYTQQWINAIAYGATALQTVAQAAATAYLTNADFTGNLTTTPATNDIEGVLAALQTDLGAGVDNKTLTTKSSTGLINFFDSLLLAPGTWNHTTDGSADYKDSVYVVSTIV